MIEILTGGMFQYTYPELPSLSRSKMDIYMDTTIEKNGLPEGVFKVVSLEFRTGNAEDWNSYTLTCQIRFAQEPQRRAEY